MIDYDYQILTLIQLKKIFFVVANYNIYMLNNRKWNTQRAYLLRNTFTLLLLLFVYLSNHHGLIISQKQCFQGLTTLILHNRCLSVYSFGTLRLQLMRFRCHVNSCKCVRNWKRQSSVLLYSYTTHTMRCVSMAALFTAGWRQHPLRYSLSEGYLS